MLNVDLRAQRMYRSQGLHSPENKTKIVLTAQISRNESHFMN